MRIDLGESAADVDDFEASALQFQFSVVAALLWISSAPPTTPVTLLIEVFIFEGACALPLADTPPPLLDEDASCCMKRILGFELYEYWFVV